MFASFSLFLPFSNISFLLLRLPLAVLLSSAAQNDRANFDFLIAKQFKSLDSVRISWMLIKLVPEIHEFKDRKGEVQVLNLILLTVEKGLPVYSANKALNERLIISLNFVFAFCFFTLGMEAKFLATRGTAAAAVQESDQSMMDGKNEVAAGILQSTGESADDENSYAAREGVSPTNVFADNVKEDAPHRDNSEAAGENNADATKNAKRCCMDTETHTDNGSAAAAAAAAADQSDDQSNRFFSSMFQPTRAVMRLLIVELVLAFSRCQAYQAITISRVFDWLCRCKRDAKGQIQLLIDLVKEKTLDEVVTMFNPSLLLDPKLFTAVRPFSLDDCEHLKNRIRVDLGNQLGLPQRDFALNDNLLPLPLIPAEKREYERTYRELFSVSRVIKLIISVVNKNQCGSEDDHESEGERRNGTGFKNLDKFFSEAVLDTQKLVEWAVNNPAFDEDLLFPQSGRDAEFDLSEPLPCFSSASQSSGGTESQLLQLPQLPLLLLQKPRPFLSEESTLRMLEVMFLPPAERRQAPASILCADDVAPSEGSVIRKANAYSSLRMTTMSSLYQTTTAKRGVCVKKMPQFPDITLKIFEESAAASSWSSSTSSSAAGQKRSAPVV